jgi:hypothetical protein
MKSFGLDGKETVRIYCNLLFFIKPVSKSLLTVFFYLNQFIQNSVVVRESGQLEQDADVIIMLWHEKKSNPRGNRYLTVTKNKEGEWFETLLAFDGKHQLFSKAQRTGETVAKYVADGKKARRQNREPEQMAFAELPNDTQVPFERSTYGSN